MEVTDIVKIYELMNDVRKEIGDLKVDVAVVKNTQEQTRTDISQLKTDIAILNKYNSQEIGEKRKGNYLKDKLFWPIVVLILGIIINPIITNLIKPLPSPQVSQPIQQVCPTQPIK